ncbi:MAG: glycosyltransferase family 4 protein [Desulfitobacteriaceae bacterium]
MKIAIATVQVPFVRGGAEILVELLKANLISRGHQVEIISIPFKWYPPSAIIDSILMARLMDLSESNGVAIDLVIGTKFPSYYVNHENKVLWLLHQHREAYELWNTDLGGLHPWENSDEVRKLIINCDNKFIPKAKKVYTISQTVTDRLKKFNGIKSKVLYHPPALSEVLKPCEYDSYIFYPSRINRIKRQALLVQALKYCKSAVHVVIVGSGENDALEELNRIIEKDGTADKVTILGRISDEELIRLYSNCLGVYFGPYEEDYGYITLEAFFSGKAVITHHDSGGPLEFVSESNGYVMKPDPRAIAEAMDELYYNKQLAREKGQNGLRLMHEMKISWDYVVEALVKV